MDSEKDTSKRYPYPPEGYELYFIPPDLQFRAIPSCQRCGVLVLNFPVHDNRHWWEDHATGSFAE